MDGELFDLVDAQDRVVGITDKAESHAKALPHRCVAVFVFFAGRLLCQKRTIHKDGLIDHSVGGHLRRGESYDAGAAREMGEELGLDVPLRFLGNAYEDARERGSEHQIIHWFGVFETEIGDDELRRMKPDSREVEKMIPLTLEETADWMRREPSIFTYGFLTTFNLYLEKKRTGIKPVPVR